MGFILAVPISLFLAFWLSAVKNRAAVVWGALIGAFIASDVDALLSRGMLRSDLNVALVGSAAIAEAWRSALTESGIPARAISVAETEKALLTALRLILVESCHTTAAKPLNRRTSSS